MKIITGTASTVHIDNHGKRMAKLRLVTWPTKLSKWWTLDFTDFVSVLKLQLSLQQKDKLLSLFEKYKKECEVLDNLTNKTDDEINREVYKLYGLTNEEIRTIEEK